MNMPLLSTLVCLAIAIGSPSWAEERQARALTLEEMAYGAPIQVQEDEAVQRLVLPVSVYRRVQDVGLGDLRVFNAAGEEVPFAVRLATDLRRRKTALQTIPLPFFPLFVQEEQDLQDVKLNIERSAEGELITLHSGKTAALASHVGGCILDASQVTDAMHSLELHWVEARPGAVATIRVERSEDLNRWSSVGTLPVADLQFGGHHLQRGRAQFSNLRGPYLRLSWKGELPMQITGVSVVLRRRGVSHARQEQLLEARPSQERGRYDFWSPGPLPVDRVSLLLPEVNTVAQITLFSAAQSKGPWRKRHQGVVYRVQKEGQEVSSEPIELGPTRHQHWRLQVAPNGGGIGSQRPMLRLQWTQEELVFLTRGSAPFTLAYGSYKTTPARFEAGVLANLIDEGGEEPWTLTATLGPEYTLGGSAALQPPPPPAPWKVYLLWLILLVGVLLLSVMTLKLVRDMKASA